MEAVNGCRSCQLDLKLNRNGLCWYCDPARVRERRLAKQAKVFRYLDARGLEGSQTDLPIDRGECGMERPDRVFQEGDRVVIVEVDEHQHKSYPVDCEERRMLMVSQYFDFRPVLWIRFNPDEYRTADEKPVRMNERLDYLGEVVDEARHRCPLDAAVKVTYLYYDEWTEAAGHRWMCLQPLDETIQVRGVLRKELPLRVAVPPMPPRQQEPVEEKGEEELPSNNDVEKPFECKRCGFRTNKQCILVKHLDRKRICDPVKADIPIEQLRKETRVFNKNTWIDPETQYKYYLCSRCGAKFKQYAGKHRHEKKCTKGPPRIFDEPTVAVDVSQLRQELEVKVREDIVQNTQKPHYVQDMEARMDRIESKLDQLLNIFNERERRAALQAERRRVAKTTEKKE